MYGIILTSAVVKNDTFRNFGAKEKPAAAIPAFWECNKGINHPVPELIVGRDRQIANRAIRKNWK